MAHNFNNKKITGVAIAKTRWWCPSYKKLVVKFCTLVELPNLWLSSPYKSQSCKTDPHNTKITKSKPAMFLPAVFSMLAGFVASAPRPQSQTRIVPEANTFGNQVACHLTSVSCEF